MSVTVLTNKQFPQKKKKKALLSFQYMITFLYIFYAEMHKKIQEGL